MHSDRAVTLQDIADELGISRSTASYAITGRGRISAETKERVLATARDLGYRPNTLARRLRGSRTGLLALRLPRSTTTMSYYTEVAFGAVEEADRARMSVSLLLSDARPAELNRLYDGVILLDPEADDASAHAMLAGSVPVVTGEPAPPGLPASRGQVASHHAEAIVELMEHLVEHGARRPSLIVPEIQSHWARTVRSAFESWCEERGFPALVAPIPHPTTPEQVRGVVAQLLSDGAEPVDAIVAGSDGIVLSVVTGTELTGCRVGADVLVSTVVDSEILTLTSPPITALDLHPREFGRRCVRVLLAILDAESAGRPSEFVEDVVPITLRPRESTLRNPVETPR